MDHHDHVALIRAGAEGVGPRWLELGAGEGAFTLALADVLGPGSTIRAMDRDGRALEVAVGAVRRRFPGVVVEPVRGDFTVDIRGPAHDGVLAANSFHFVRDRATTLAAIRDVLRPGGRLVIVEYDADRGNPWVPFPFSFERWLGEAAAAGFVDIRPLHRVGSRFMGGIYGAVASRPSGGDRAASK
jgi:ubiquinone/menaquinone biosynthesis C-methylase UbiE